MTGVERKENAGGATGAEGSGIDKGGHTHTESMEGSTGEEEGRGMRADTEMTTHARRHSAAATDARDAPRKRVSIVRRWICWRDTREKEVREVAAILSRAPSRRALPSCFRTLNLLPSLSSRRRLSLSLECPPLHCSSGLASCCYVVTSWCGCASLCFAPGVAGAIVACVVSGAAAAEFGSTAARVRWNALVAVACLPTFRA